MKKKILGIVLIFILSFFMLGNLNFNANATEDEVKVEDIAGKWMWCETVGEGFPMTFHQQISCFTEIGDFGYMSTLGYMDIGEDGIINEISCIYDSAFEDAEKVVVRDTNYFLEGEELDQAIVLTYDYEEDKLYALTEYGVPVTFSRVTGLTDLSLLEGSWSWDYRFSEAKWDNVCTDKVNFINEYITALDSSKEDEVINECTLTCENISDVLTVTVNIDGTSVVFTEEDIMWQGTAGYVNEPGVYTFAFTYDTDYDQLLVGIDREEDFKAYALSKTKKNVYSLGYDRAFLRSDEIPNKEDFGTLPGYEFIGWYTEPFGGDQVDETFEGAVYFAHYDMLDNVFYGSLYIDESGVYMADKYNKIPSETLADYGIIYEYKNNKIYLTLKGTTITSEDGYGIYLNCDAEVNVIDGATIYVEHSVAFEEEDSLEAVETGITCLGNLEIYLDYEENVLDTIFFEIYLFDSLEHPGTNYSGICTVGDLAIYGIQDSVVKIDVDTFIYDADSISGSCYGILCESGSFESNTNSLYVKSKLTGITCKGAMNLLHGVDLQVYAYYEALYNYADNVTSEIYNFINVNIVAAYAYRTDGFEETKFTIGGCQDVYLSGTCVTIFANDFEVCDCTNVILTTESFCDAGYICYVGVGCAFNRIENLNISGPALTFMTGEVSFIDIDNGTISCKYRYLGIGFEEEIPVKIQRSELTFYTLDFLNYLDEKYEENGIVQGAKLIFLDDTVTDYKVYGYQTFDIDAPRVDYNDSIKDTFKFLYVEYKKEVEFVNLDKVVNEDNHLEYGEYLTITPPILIYEGQQVDFDLIYELFYIDPEGNGMEQVEDIDQFGKYLLYMTVRDWERNYKGETFVEFSYGPKVVEIIWTDGPFTYDGTDQTSSLKASYFDLDEVEHTLLYTLEQNDEAATFKNAGDYTLVVSGFDPLDTTPENHVLPSLLTHTVTMNKREIDVNISDASRTYGVNGNVPTASCDGLATGDEANKVYKINYPTALTTGAGSYDVTGEVLDSNYDITFIGSNGNKGVYTINKANITVTANDASKTYGDVELLDNGYTVTGGYVTGDALNIALARESGENVGTYAITATESATNPNYNITLVPGTFTITPRHITVTIEDKTCEYGTSVELTSTAEGILSSDNASDVYRLSCPATNVSLVGTYDITGDKLNTNYDITFVGSNGNKGKYVITRAEKPLTNVSIESWIEGETPKTPTGSHPFGEVEFMYSVDSNEPNFSATVPTLPGNYILKAYVVGNPQYDSAMAEVKFTIYKDKIIAPVDSEGNVIENPSAYIVDTERGLDPEARLVITNLDKDSVKANNSLLDSLDMLEKHEKVLESLDAKLLLGTETVEFDGSITIEAVVPTKLVDKVFKLFHIHTEGDDTTVTEVTYSLSEDGKTIRFNVDDLSEFAFVAESKGCFFHWIAIAGMVVACLAVLFYFLKKAYKALLYVGSGLGFLAGLLGFIIYGCAICLLLVCIILLGIGVYTLILFYFVKKESNKQEESK